jgi:hypothetical protein
MKIHNIEQRTPEWYALHLGRPTASEFDKIISPKTGKPSASSKAYACRLVAERLTGESQTPSLDNIADIARGKALEPDAIRNYEFVEEIDTLPVGFITTDDGEIGASPDRLIVGVAAGAEIKCPKLTTHIGYWADGPGDAYRPQVQGQLYVCEFEWVDFYSYHPQMAPLKLRTRRDDAYIRLLAQGLKDFTDLVSEIEAKVRPLFYGAPNLAELIAEFAETEAA